MEVLCYPHFFLNAHWKTRLEKHLKKTRGNLSNKNVYLLLFFIRRGREEEGFPKRGIMRKYAVQRDFQLVLISSSPFSLFLLCCEFALLSRNGRSKVKAGWLKKVSSPKLYRKKQEERLKNTEKKE